MNLTEVLSGVEKVTTVESSVLSLVQGIADVMLSLTQEELSALPGQLKAFSGQAAAAVVANTPAAAPAATKSS